MPPNDASPPPSRPPLAGDDVPAAHSMDTEWFAVDANGHVAIFDTGEDGALPIAAANLGGDATAAHQLVQDEERPLALFCYARDHGDDPGRYQRTAAPPQPLHVDDLPAAVRQAVGALRLPVSFSADETIHLADHLRDEQACYWGEDWTLRGFGPGLPRPEALAAQRQGALRRQRLALLFSTALLVVIWLMVYLLRRAR